VNETGIHSALTNGIANLSVWHATWGHWMRG